MFSDVSIYCHIYFGAFIFNPAFSFIVQTAFIFFIRKLSREARYRETSNNYLTRSGWSASAPKNGGWLVKD